MENFKYIKNVADGNGVIFLYGQIGDAVDSEGNYVFGISGAGFAYELKWLQENCKSIEVRINSIGGSVLDGYSIVSAILASKVPVNTYVDGLAASIAGVIAVAGKKCYMMDYSTMMLHNPSGGEDKKVLSLIKDTLVTILSNRSNVTPEDIDKMMNKETWLTAIEAKEQGFVDEIVTSEKKVKIKKSESLENRLAIYNILLNPKNTMSKVNAILKLKNDASEEVAVESIETIQKENETLKASNAEMKTKLEALEAEKATKEQAEKDAIVTEATAVVNKAVVDKKITEEEKADTLALASSSRKNLEVVKNLFGKENKKEAVKVFDAKNVLTNKGSEDRSSWSIRDWETKDEKGLMDMHKNNNEEYTKLYNAFYKK